MATTKVDPKLDENDIAKKAQNYQGLTSRQLVDAYRTVSYTHLTLPTN